jgi:hypothetical protein
VLPTVTNAAGLLFDEHYLFTAGWGGLGIVNVEPPTDPRVVLREDLSYPEVVARAGDFHLIGDGSNLIAMRFWMDIGEVSYLDSLPMRVGMPPQQEYVADIDVWGQLAFVANGRFGGLTTVDISNLLRPPTEGNQPGMAMRPIGVMTTTGFASKVVLSGPDGNEGALAVLGDSREGLLTLDVRNPITPTIIAATGGAFYPYGVDRWNDIVVVAGGEDGAFVYEVGRDPALPATFGQLRRLSAFWPGLNTRTVVIRDGIAFMGGTEGGVCRVAAFTLADPTDPREVGCWSDSRPVDAMDISGDLLAVSALDQGVNLVRIERAPVTATPTSSATPIPRPTSTERPGRAVYLPATTSE